MHISLKNDLKTNIFTKRNSNGSYKTLDQAGFRKSLKNKVNLFDNKCF